MNDSLFYLPIFHEANIFMTRTDPSATSLTPDKTPDDILFQTAFASVNIFSPIVDSLESVF